MQILLASNSPRRRQLLAEIAPDFSIAQMHDIDETNPSDMPAHEVPAYLSRLKADAYRGQLGNDDIIITADTVVIDNNKVLGKPHSPAEAVDMLKSLRGHSHKVITGVTISSLAKTITFAESTEVTFDNISDEEIMHYVEKFKPFDKAGAYGIQEWIGCIGISSIKGCFYNVMGLPLNSLYKHLKDFGYFYR